MSQRIRKVESIVQHAVATRLHELLGMGTVSVTGVEVSADIKSATVWVGILASSEEEKQNVFSDVSFLRGELQSALAEQMKSKYVPRISLRLDKGGEYAEYISRLLSQL